MGGLVCVCGWVGGRDSLVCGEGRGQTHRAGRAGLGTWGGDRPRFRSIRAAQRSTLNRQSTRRATTHNVPEKGAKYK